MPYYNHHIQSKLPKIGTTIFTTMSKLANDHGAINLSQGFPDFDVDERLKNLAIKYIKKATSICTNARCITFKRSDK